MEHLRENEIIQNIIIRKEITSDSQLACCIEKQIPTNVVKLVGIRFSINKYIDTGLSRFVAGTGNFIIDKKDKLIDFLVEYSPTANLLKNGFIRLDHNIEDGIITANYKDAGKMLAKSGAKTITAITKADPCKITAVAHGLTTGNKVYLETIAGMTELNNRNFAKITKIDADNFTLDDIDSSAYTTYSSGGKVFLNTFTSYYLTMILRVIAKRKRY